MTQIPTMAVILIGITRNRFSSKLIVLYNEN